MAENSLFPGEPEAPKFNQTNPLQLAGQMQELGLRGAQMQKAQSEAQQQQLTLTAKQALGGIMQKHINPQTGEFDHVKAYGEMAAHPELGIIMPEVTETFLRMPGIKAEALSKEVDFHRNKYSLDSELFAEALRQAQAPGADMKSIATDLMIKRRNAGVVSPDESLAVLPQLVEMSKNPSNFQRSLMRASQFGQAAQKSLEDAHLGLGYNTEEVQTINERGQKVMVPRYMAGGQTPGQAALYPNTAAGGVAPSSEAAVRQEGFPSTPPAGRVIEEAPAQTKARGEDVDRFNEAKKQILLNQQGAIIIDQRIGEAERVLKEFKTGPGRETFMKLAGLAGAFGLDQWKDALAGGDYAAAQEFVKLMVPQSLELLRNTLGGQGRITNLEVEQFFKANPNLETDPKAIEKIFAFTKRLNRLAREEAQSFKHYEKRAEKSGKYDITTFDTDWAHRIENDPSLKISNEGE